MRARTFEIKTGSPLTVGKRSAFSLAWVTALAVMGMIIPEARADLIVGDATNYTVLYEGTGGHNLQITNVIVNGNLGVGGTGVVQDSGPAVLAGGLDLSASNTGQFHNNNAKNIGPFPVNYNVAAVTSALNFVNDLNSGWGGQDGTDVSISGNTTINASAGMLHTIIVDGQSETAEVFDVTGFSLGNGQTITINDVAGSNVVFNFLSSLGNVNFQGDVVLNGLTGDQLLWNVVGTGKHFDINNNASTFGTGFGSPAAQGIFLNPNGEMSSVNANIVGRFFGGDSQDMQIVSGTNLIAPPPGGGSTGGSTGGTIVPEPSSIVLLLTVLAGLGLGTRRKAPAFHQD